MPLGPEWVKPRRRGAIETRQVSPQQRKGRLAIVTDDKCQQPKFKRCGAPKTVRLRAMRQLL
jgi:hypothetical protein